MEYLFKRKERCTHDNLFFTCCGICKKRIILDIPERSKDYRIHDMHTCNECIPENSSIRNGMDESCFTDISDSLWKRK